MPDTTPSSPRPDLRKSLIALDTNVLAHKSKCLSFWARAWRSLGIKVIILPQVAKEGQGLPASAKDGFDNSVELLRSESAVSALITHCTFISKLTKGVDPMARLERSRGRWFSCQRRAMDSNENERRRRHCAADW